MANFPLSTFCARSQLMFMTTLLLMSPNFVHTRGLSALEDGCGSCYREIGRTIVEMVSGQPDTDTRLDGRQVDIQTQVRDHSNGLVALLMGTEGSQSREDLQCFTCWVIARRLKKSVGISRDVDESYESFGKRAMLNNGWV